MSICTSLKLFVKQFFLASDYLAFPDLPRKFVFDLFSNCLAMADLVLSLTNERFGFYSHFKEIVND